MKQRTYIITAVTLLLASVLPAWSQQLSLKPVSLEKNTQLTVCVPVQEVKVQTGDTLSGLSRKFSGRGSYFPQILLLNEIKNPDKIYTGDTLKLPVATANAPKSKKPSESRESKPHVKSKAAVYAKRAKHINKSAKEVDASAGQRLYERAIKAYRREDYRTAVELFDRFLAEHPASALAADASLYKAECYLKQSNQ